MTGESLLRRWRLDNPLPNPWGGPGATARPRESDEELDGQQHYPARRSLHWLPSGLGTNWDLRGENAHPVRHPKSHQQHGHGHGRHHHRGEHATTSAAPASGPATSASASTPASTPVPAPANRTLGARVPVADSSAAAAAAPSLERFVPLALSSASRGDVADVVVLESEPAAEVTPQPAREDDSSIRIRPLSPAVDVACYSSNQRCFPFGVYETNIEIHEYGVHPPQVLIIIAMTCMLSLGFIAVVMGCVHCCTTTRSKEAGGGDDMVDICDARDCHRAYRGPTCPRSPRTWPHPLQLQLAGQQQGAAAGPRHHLPLLRRLVQAVVAHPRQRPHPRPEDADQSDDSEEELLFPAPSGAVASGSASMISLHSLHSVRERQASVSMEDLLLLGRCR
ncbi:Disintegrin pyramidin-B [Frankliniella fusca]|uniref:Disintegrin pyramidin-B n=1 Tax=Frankliniella fusca TaxID=407009 RepID=A0AAE1LRK0_9NEOP|nr:Disintegrin pyramidin-B [Frankliniella fusca]